VFFFVLLYNKKGFLFEIKRALFETGDEEKSIKKNESRNENWRI
jgi:hypothetical protein